MRRDAVVGLDTAFNGFLQAPIDEDRGERLLSVLSALARLDLDPWQEAEELAALSPEAAIRRLAAAISKLPDASRVQRNPATIAPRLIALLPRTHRHRAIPEQPAEVVGETLSSATLRKALLASLFILLMLALVIGWRVS